MGRYELIPLLILLVSPLSGAFNPRYTPAAYTLYNSDAEAQLVAVLGAGKGLPLPLLSAGIIASGGARTTEFRRLEQVFENTLHRIQYLTRSVKNHKRLAREVLAHFHDLLFRRYHSSRTTLLNVLNTGEFNCVSSSMLYNIALSRLGLTTRVVLVPGHVYSQVRIGSKWIDVETTHRGGFNPIRQKDLPDKAENREFIPEKGDPGKKAFLDNRFFPALLFYNRGTILFNEDNPAVPIAFFVKALKILPTHQESEKNLLAVFARWIGQSVKKGDTDTALVRINEAVSALGRRPLFTRLTHKAYEEGARIAVEKDNFKKAIKLLLRLRGTSRDPDGSILQRIQGYYAQWAQHLLREKRFRDMLYVINSAAAKWPSPFLQNFKIHLVSRAAVHFFHGASPAGGIDFYNTNIPIAYESRTAMVNRQFLYMEWGKHSLRTGKFEQAYNTWQSALGIYPGYRPFHTWKEETIKRWVAHLIRSPSVAVWMIRIWALFRKTGDTRFLQEIHAPFARSIKTLMADNKFEEAFSILEQLRLKVSRIPGLLEVDRELIALFHAWGSYLERQHKYPQGIKVWKQGLIRYPGEASFSRALSRTYHLHARNLLDRGRFTEARAVLQEALVHFPQHKALRQLAAYFGGK